METSVHSASASTTSGATSKSKQTGRSIQPAASFRAAFHQRRRAGAPGSARKHSAQRMLGAGAISGCTRCHSPRHRPRRGNEQLLDQRRRRMSAAILHRDRVLRRTLTRAIRLQKQEASSSRSCDHRHAKSALRLKPAGACRRGISPASRPSTQTTDAAHCASAPAAERIPNRPPAPHAVLHRRIEALRTISKSISSSPSQCAAVLPNVAIASRDRGLRRFATSLVSVSSRASIVRSARVSSSGAAGLLNRSGCRDRIDKARELTQHSPSRLRH